ncbi:MAG TPA: phage tail sheath C-terminal domain-containing protein [Chloroflexia bacterium]|nr:phage tail sheath C-terminal domain-containing protein [Chloroflexia bacterium]
MPTYETPGVYYERVDATGPAISPLRTDVAGFVGIAERGPINTPTPVQSWRQFQAYFGDFTGQGFLAYNVRAFFENGGRRCWVVRVASPDPAGGAASASTLLPGAAPPGSPPGTPPGKSIWQVEAYSPGVWGNALTILLQETHRAQTVSRPAFSTPEATAVTAVGAFRRAMLVRVRQGNLTPLYKVISSVDPADGLLIWQNPRQEERLPYDSLLQLPPDYDLDAPLYIESVEYTLVVKEAGQVRAVYEGLSLVPEDAQNYGPKRLAPLEPLPPANPDQRAGIPSAPPLVVIREAEDKEQSSDAPSPLYTDGGEESLAGGADGLTLLEVYDFIGEPFSPHDSDLIKKSRKRGLRTLNDVDEVAIIAIPDIHIQPIPPLRLSPPVPCEPDPCLPGPPPKPALPPPLAEPEMPRIFSDEEIARVHAALVQHCEERRDRIAILDPPLSAVKNEALGVGAIRAWRKRFDSKYAALYYPWMRVVEPVRPARALTRDIPPSGHVAGQYATADFSVGVHKAPANVALKWAQDVTAGVSDPTHGLLNTEGINVIKALPGRGLRIEGARTVSADPDWRYVNVRRLLMMIEKAIYLCTQWAVFEPNDHITRAKMRLSLTSFLSALWQRGALTGDKLAEAFAVKCDEENNPPHERANGRLLAEVRVAPSRPFEFVVLRVGRTQNEFEVSEASVERVLV